MMRPNSNNLAKPMVHGFIQELLKHGIYIKMTLALNMLANRLVARVRNKY